MTTVECDYLIVGAGTAGSVLAARLSDDSKVKVVLIEAGQDVRPPNVPADIADLFPLSTFNPRYAWRDLKVHWRSRDNSPAVPFQQGRVVGGGSAIMGMWAVRGMPQDYDDWANAGATGWSWKEVLPFFRYLEADQDFGGDSHGAEGPLPIRRQPKTKWSALATAMRQIAMTRGFREVEDMNSDFSDGHCSLPITRFANSRASAGLCYLNSSVRSRPNLEVLTQTEVQRLDFNGKCVVGASGRRADGSVVQIKANRTIVTSGAIYSPALLMRSGIGAPEELKGFGIEIVADRHGVGKNLQNHPLLPAIAWLTKQGRDSGRGNPPASTYLRWSSNVAGLPRGDLGMYIRSYLVWHALGRQMAMVGPVLMRPLSRGDVRLDRQDPFGSVSVAFNFLEDNRDLERMVLGFQLSAAMLADPHLRLVCGEAFALLNAAKLYRYNDLSRLNEIRAYVASWLLDFSPGLANRLISRFAEMRPLNSFVHDRAALEEFILNNISGTNHVTGTCRMGSSQDPLAVTNSIGEVIGLDGLTVADASIMPNVPSGNTHIATVMVAEKIAVDLKR